MNKPKDGVKKLILDYFNCDVFELYDLSPGIKENIIDTFTFAYNHHLSCKEISEQLGGSNICELRERIRSYNNPFPVRLGHFKPKLQEDAFKVNDGTIHGMIRDIIAIHYQRKELISRDPVLRLIDMAYISRHNIKHHNYREKYGAGILQTSLF